MSRFRACRLCMILRSSQIQVTGRSRIRAGDVDGASFHGTHMRTRSR